MWFSPWRKHKQVPYLYPPKKHYPPALNRRVKEVVDIPDWAAGVRFTIVLQVMLAWQGTIWMMKDFIHRSLLTGFQQSLKNNDGVNMGCKDDDLSQKGCFLCSRWVSLINLLN